MGHAIRYMDFPRSTTKSDIRKEVDEVCTMDGDNHHGLDSPIEFKHEDDPASCYEDAKRIIDALCDARGAFYRCVCIPYKVENSNCKAIADANHKYEAARTKFNELNDAFHFASAKSEYIGCKKCGSKLARKYMKSNYCPLCREDLRPQTTIEKIESLRKKMLEAETARDNAIKENARNSKNIRWLIRFEYHV